jgi:hypothetical protein
MNCNPTSHRSPATVLLAAVALLAGCTNPRPADNRDAALEGRRLGEWRRGESNPGRRGTAVGHESRKRPLVLFDHPGGARHVPPNGHRVPKPSALCCQHHSVSAAQSGCCRPRRPPLAKPECSRRRNMRRFGTVLNLANSPSCDA